MVWTSSPHYCSSTGLSNRGGAGSNDKKGDSITVIATAMESSRFFLKKYITCEGRYQTIYNSKLPLLSHLRHRVLLNIPYYLLNDLYHMAGFVRVAKHPLSSLTHHGLIKLIFLRTLAQHIQTWEQFTARVQEPAPLPDVPTKE